MLFRWPDWKSVHRLSRLSRAGHRNVISRDPRPTDSKAKLCVFFMCSINPDTPSVVEMLRYWTYTCICRARVSWTILLCSSVSSTKQCFVIMSENKENVPDFSIHSLSVQNLLPRFVEFASTKSNLLLNLSYQLQWVKNYTCSVWKVTSTKGKSTFEWWRIIACFGSYLDYSKIPRFYAYG